MIVTRLERSRVFYRCLTPKWSYLPLSGAGAAQNGGRFNRPGVEALYLSDSPPRARGLEHAPPETAFAEYGQDSSIIPPGTLVAYTAQVDLVVDFSGGFDEATRPAAWSAWSSDWKYIARIERRAPPTWHLADGLVSEGFKGLLFPSMRYANGVNLVLFTGNLTDDDHIHVLDQRDGSRAISCCGRDRPGRTFRACRQGNRSIRRLALAGATDPFSPILATLAGAGCPPARAQRSGAGGGPNALIIKRRREGRRLWSTRFSRCLLTRPPTL